MRILKVEVASHRDKDIVGCEMLSLVSDILIKHLRALRSIVCVQIFVSDKGWVIRESVEVKATWGVVKIVKRMRQNLT